MDPQVQMGIVYVVVLTATIITWKLVRDFYKTKFHMIFTHLIAVITASFMFLSSMSLFVPKNYQRGVTAEVEVSIMSILTVVVMVGVLYLFFKYIPDNKKEK